MGLSSSKLPPPSTMDVERIFLNWENGSKVGDVYLLKFVVMSQGQEGSMRDKRAHHGLLVDVAGACNADDIRGIFFRMNIVISSFPVIYIHLC